MAGRTDRLRSLFNYLSGIFVRSRQQIQKIPTTTNKYRVVSSKEQITDTSSKQTHLCKHKFAQPHIILQSDPSHIRQWSERFMDAYRMSEFAVAMDPPESVRGMTELDRHMFKKKMKVPGLKIPARKVGILKKSTKMSMLKVRLMKPVAELSDDDHNKKTHKLILLDPEKYKSYQDLEQSDRQLLQENDIQCKDFDMYDVEMTYENWNVQDILRAVIPVSSDSVTSFSVIGHIAHLNLKPEVYPYKKLIGQVISDKLPNISTVVNKLDVIDNTFRNFKMELLAGEDNYVTQVRENGCIYEFDFSKVYWNPRLSTEHGTMISQLEKGDTVYDMFAGVGPFAIPAARRGISVKANDLNPDSYSSLQRNISLNRIKPDMLTAYNLDGRAFIRTVVKSDLMKRIKSDPQGSNMHVLMNLPASAIEFLDCFVSLLADCDLVREDVDDANLPVVHCYCFSKSVDPRKDVVEQGERIIAKSLTDVSVRFVRNVAPNKDMLCLTFRLTKDILFHEVQEVGLNLNEDGEPEAKRVKTN
ncbi:tRNA (guanine(37)-N(1))-methyltransferase-like [Haliotis cracherodii]|uniref:tRNA (guanine(37)-N(1))-methyltransferase-like n=1 Tax=Haliotis cracherodii TaxID=6455 RepID=UPI0039E8A78E